METASQIRSGLQAQGLPPPTVAWIQSVMPNRNPLPPLPALVATVKARLFVADITAAGLFDADFSRAFPPDVSNVQVQDTKLNNDVLVQVLDIDNLTKSKWEQVEELEAIQRGEQTRGREIIRLPTGAEDEDEVNGTATQPVQSAGGPNAALSAAKNSTHKLVLQDCKGQRVYGLELRRIERIGVGTLSIGEKILLKKGTAVARGLMLLEPSNCILLGGKVEAWQKAWVDGRLARLKETLDSD